MNEMSEGIVLKDKTWMRLEAARLAASNSIHDALPYLAHESDKYEMCVVYWLGKYMEDKSMHDARLREVLVDLMDHMGESDEGN